MMKSNVLKMQLIRPEGDGYCIEIRTYNRQANGSGKLIRTSRKHVKHLDQQDQELMTAIFATKDSHEHCD